MTVLLIAAGCTASHGRRDAAVDGVAPDSSGRDGGTGVDAAMLADAGTARDGAPDSDGGFFPQDIAPADEHCPFDVPRVRAFRGGRGARTPLNTDDALAGIDGLSCSFWAQGPELIVRFDTDETRLDISAGTLPSTRFQHVLEVRRGHCVEGPVVACREPFGAATSNIIAWESFRGEPMFVILVPYEGGAGPVDLLSDDDTPVFVPGG